MTYSGNNLDLFVLHLIENVSVLQSLNQSRSFFYLSIQKGYKVLQFRTTIFKIFRKPFAACFI